MKSKRKQNFVDKRVQGSLMRRICLHWAFFMAVTFAAFVGMQAIVGDPALTFGERVAEKAREMSIMFAITLALFPVFLLDTIKFSNRFAGPVARLHRAMKDLANNANQKDLVFREGDFWAELATEFNRVKSRVEQAESASEERSYDSLA